MILTEKNIKVGLIIINTQHPEWSRWVVEKDKNGYNKRGKSGSTILIPSEYHFWEISE